MKKGLAIIMMGLLVLTFSGCQAPTAPVPSPDEESAPSEPADPLAEAKRKLFEELGVEEEIPTPSQEGESLPVVLPTPPELPKTDADLTE